MPVKNYVSVRSGTDHFYNRVSREKNATVAFLGGSITYNPGWRDKVCAYFKSRFPETKFRFIAAGIPSLGSLPHAFRLQRDVLDSGRVDLLFVEAAVNDRGNGTDSLTQLLALEGIVRHARKANSAMDILLMTFADPLKTGDYDKGMIPVEIANQERIAEYYHLPSINLAKEVRDKINNGEFGWEKDFKDLHPSPFGQQLYYEAIRTLLDSASAHRRFPAPCALPQPLNAANFESGRLIVPAIGIAEGQWQFGKDWTPDDSLPTRTGFVHVPVFQSGTPGDILAFRFRGSAVGIGIISGPDAGIISWSLDGNSYRDRDLYTQWSTQLHLPWFLLLASGLKTEEHLLKIKVSPDKNPASRGHSCRLVYFLQNE